jgi:predicted cupin superfamily sugar epimerase
VVTALRRAPAVRVRDTVLSPADIKRLLRLGPLPHEGGYFRETFRCALRVNTASGDRNAGTAIYYLLEPGIFSALHRLPGDEVFHFYMGDPVEMLQLHPDGSSRVVVIGSDLGAGMEPQLVVAGGVWQGCRLVDGGRYSLMGTTMSPGFDPADFELGARDSLVAAYPRERERITALTAPDANR